MKKIFFSLLALSGLSGLTMSLPSFASDEGKHVATYFSKDRMKTFACTIAQSIKTSYPKKSLHKLRGDILDVLRKDINPWVDAYPIPAGISLPGPLSKITGLPGFPMDRSEYYIPNAFILYGNPSRELKEPSENYFASYIYLARSRYISYLNGEEKRFKLKDETNLREQIEANLPQVANYAFPYQDQNGLPIMQRKVGVKEKDLYKLAIGVPTHKKYDQFVYESQKYNEFSSPLFMWLLEQEDFSVSPEKLFDKAMEIYGNPIVALGVIPWVFSGDALTVNRGTSSVVSYKIERLVDGDDITGFQYHFWGYLTQGVVGNRARVEALAYVYEYLIQKDYPDWTIDALSLYFSQQIRKSFKNPELCGKN